MIVFIPSLICVCLLVAHSAIVRGPEFTRQFFLACFVMYEMKGLSDYQNARLDYIPQTKLLEHGGVNYGVFFIILPIGWTFAHYCALCIAEALLARNPRKAGRFWQMNGLCILMVCLVGFCMEGSNHTARWWIWREGIEESFLQYILVWLPWASGFFPFFFINRLNARRPDRLWIWSLAYLFGFYGFLTVIFWILPAVGKLALFALCGFYLLMPFRNGGPELRPLRRRPLFA